MATINDSIRALSEVGTINELNNEYCAIVLAAQQLASRGFFDETNTYDGFLATLNHITNYNIIRVANLAYEGYAASGMKDASKLIEIERCRSSIKEHEDNSTEIGLLDDLCERLHIA